MCELLTEREGDDLVFPSKRGFQRQPNDDAGWCTRKRKKGVLEPGLQELAGITRRVRFHDLRHTCASHLVMGTWGSPWPLADVAKMLRHSSITVTERYAHLAPGYLHEQARRTARTTAAGPKLALSDPSPSASPDAVTQGLGHDLSHPSGLNRRPAVYETVDGRRKVESFRIVGEVAAHSLCTQALAIGARPAPSPPAVRHQADSAQPSQSTTTSASGPQRTVSVERPSAPRARVAGAGRRGATRAITRGVSAAIGRGCGRNAKHPAPSRAGAVGNTM
jgi:hypothetical protein